ncbi:MAG TPA: formylglycine-generating enzyme family protein, partial [Gemmataceae bacterium]
NLPVWYFDLLTSMLPRHRVAITAPFYAGASEVTVGQFRRFVEATGYRTEAERDGKGGGNWVGDRQVRKPEFVWQTPAGEPAGGDHPAVHLTYADARAFCDWLSKSEGRTYRPPTEAEWEYFCRAGTATLFHTGEALPEGAGNCAMRIRGLARVGSYPSNPFGLHDLHGNVWEWCQDYYGDTTYATSPKANPGGPRDGNHRVIRGGAWDTEEVRCGSAYRLACPPTDRDAFVGLRVVLVGDLKPNPTAQPTTPPADTSEPNKP